MKCCTDIHVPQRMNPTDLGDSVVQYPINISASNTWIGTNSVDFGRPLTFLMKLTFLFFCEMFRQILDGLQCSLAQRSSVSRA